GRSTAVAGCLVTEVAAAQREEREKRDQWCLRGSGHASDWSRPSLSVTPRKIVPAPMNSAAPPGPTLRGTAITPTPEEGGAHDDQDPDPVPRTRWPLRGGAAVLRRGARRTREDAV